MSQTLDVKQLIRTHLLEGPREYDYPIDTLLSIIRQVKPIFKQQPILLQIYSPLHVCADLHGQYNDLLNIFQNCGWPYSTRYLFLGDYVDRGSYSLEVIVLLFACKIAYPNDFYLLRGNHEIASTNKAYGFWTDLRIRYPHDWKLLFDCFVSAFAEMPVSALVNDTILCVHGGIAPSLQSLNDIRKLKRAVEPSGLCEDILWSDPSPGQGFSRNRDRGCSYTFGQDVVTEKCSRLGISRIVRGHQMITKGYSFFANKKVITLFSAPAYDSTYNNLGAVLMIDHVGKISFFTFKASKPITRRIPRLKNMVSTDIQPN